MGLTRHRKRDSRDWHLLCNGPGRLIQKNADWNLYLQEDHQRHKLEPKDCATWRQHLYFQCKWWGINLGGLTEPVSVLLTIGIDSGTTKVAHYTQ